MQLSDQFLARALEVIPGGVNSPVRAFGAVGGQPPFIAEAAGARVRDVDGRDYIDYVCSWGAVILGHAAAPVVQAVQQAAARGLFFGAPTAAEVELAETLCRLVPGLERVRLVNSGTEATMSAIRLARAATGRPLLVKFAGCYHGHADSLLVNAGSGALTFGVPSSPGVPSDVAALTLTAPYNDLAAVEALFQARGADIAAVIVEPVAGNMGCVLPQPGFLEGLRRLCDGHGSVLIFDEVMTGFRVALGGAQARCGVTADLVTLGKVIGGGMPVGAYGGRADLMAQMAPAGPVYQAGTLSGNPLAMVAGLATLRKLDDPALYARLDDYTERLITGLRGAARAADVPFSAQHVGSMFGLYFADTIPADFKTVTACDLPAFNRFFHAMLDAGVSLAPSAYEAGFVSAVHGDAELRATLAAASAAFHKLA